MISQELWINFLDGKYYECDESTRPEIHGLIGYIRVIEYRVYKDDLAIKQKQLDRALIFLKDLREEAPYNCGHTCEWDIRGLCDETIQQIEELEKIRGK